MAALSASNTNTAHSRGAEYVTHTPLAAVTDVFYAGAACYVNPADGGVTPVPAAGYTFGGFVLTEVSATADVTRVRVGRGGWWDLPITAAVTDIGKYVFSEVAEGSDNPADFAIFATGVAAAVNDICIGRIVDVVGTTPTIDTSDRAVDIVGT